MTEPAAKSEEKKTRKGYAPPVTGPVVGGTVKYLLPESVEVQKPQYDSAGRLLIDKKTKRPLLKAVVITSADAVLVAIDGTKATLKVIVPVAGGIKLLKDVERGDKPGQWQP